jgi:RES domain
LITPPPKPLQTLLWHICPARHRDEALYFGRRNKNRFDDPRGKYGTLYVSPDLTTVFLESVFHNRKLKTPADHVVTQQFLSKWVVKPILLPHALNLANLSAPYALANMGYDNSVLTVRGAYTKSKTLSRKLHQAVPEWDGLIWDSRQGGSTDCVVLFDRCAAQLVHAPPDIDLLRHFHFPRVVSDLHLIVC